MSRAVPVVMVPSQVSPDAAALGGWIEGVVKKAVREALAETRGGAPAVAAHALDPKTLMSGAEVAALLRVTKSTLSSWRSRGTGPRFVVQGSLTMYERGDVVAWIETQKR